MTEITNVAAWWGAVLATIALTFNVWKYTRERARLKVRIFAAAYPDGGVAKVEETPHGEESTPNLYYHVEVANIGERSTTIMGVSATSKDTLRDKIKPPTKTFQGVIGGGIFTPHYGKALPHVIGPGEVWSCRVPLDQIENLKQGGRPKLALSVSGRRPLLVPFPPPKPVYVG